MHRKLWLLLVLPLCLGGCRQTPPNPRSAELAQGKIFHVRGKVLGTDATHVTLDHEAVPGFMGAMTMSYKLRDPNVVSELHPGDQIVAKILVQQDATGFHNPVLDDIIVVGQARPDYIPAVQYHVPQPGDQVPDFKLINQSARMIHLKQFRGKVLLLTFIYTRCTLADYCPRMSRNFARIDDLLSSDPKLYADTHLLSISFDPAYDTPKVLRSYGGGFTGKYTQENFAHWDFAVPPAKELPDLTQFFDVGVTPGSNSSLTHTLSTVLIGKDGKVIAWYPTNEWRPEDVVEQMRLAAGV